jgi:pilus assembly protein CpaB
MNRRVSIILGVAFIIAAACAYLVYRVVGTHMAASAPKPATTRVLAAVRDIQIGTVLAANDLTTTEIAGTVPKGVLIKPEDAIGRGVLSDLYQGELIDDGRLAATGSGGGLASTIPPGMRACAVKVDDVVGISGFATPGMRVDVIISGTPPSITNQFQSQGTEVRTLLQNIEVLSAGTDIQKDASGPKQVQVVNLLVTPEQAQLLSLASNQAHIQLVLRNPLDTKITPIDGTAMSNVFTGVASTAVQAPSGVTVKRQPTTHTYTVDVINGSVHSRQTFTTPEGK